MSLRKVSPPITIHDFITTDKFAQMMGIKKHQLDYRLKCGHIKPEPQKFGCNLIFEADAQIVVPERKKGGGRPKGSTIANGAKSRGYPRSREEKIISRKRINKLTKD